MLRLAALLLPALLLSCNPDELVCGAGTHEEDGECAPDEPDEPGTDGTYELVVTRAEVVSGTCFEEELRQEDMSLEIAGEKATIVEWESAACDEEDGAINSAGDVVASCVFYDSDGPNMDVLAQQLDLIGAAGNGEVAGTLTKYYVHWEEIADCRARADFISR